METIFGRIVDVIYENDENNFKIVIVESEGCDVTVTGVMPEFEIGEFMKFVGKYVNHNIYGEQFSASEAFYSNPTEEDDILSYLASGIVKGIGESLAKRIVDYFGKDTLDIMENSPEKLLVINGIGKSKLKGIIESFDEKKNIKSLVMYLQKFGVSVNMASKIYKMYDQMAIDVIRANPYQLIDDIRGIGFKIADNIAVEMGLERDSYHRIRASVNYCLNGFISEGNTYSEYMNLISSVKKLIMVEEDKVEDVIRKMTVEGELFLEKFDEEMGVFPVHLYYQETFIMKKIIELNAYNFEDQIAKIKFDIDELQERKNIKLHENQILAVELALDNGVSIITGGPGTGKTTIIKCIIDIFESNGYKVVLCAPTGRAAKRMTEATMLESKTIHRLLEFSKFDEGYGGFSRNDENPIIGDVIIVDEVSMVDVTLMHYFLKAISYGTRVVFVGDSDQLPSVGPGNVLLDLLNSDIVSSMRLTEIFRQAAESMIIVNAHRVNEGKMPMANVKDKDFYFIESSRDEKVVEVIKGLIKKRLPEYYGLDPVKEIQILSPVKNSNLGTKNINTEIQSLINPSKNSMEIKSGDRVFRKNDKVMQIKNNYNIEWEDEKTGAKVDGIFNGDIGIIEEVNEEGLIIRFDETKLVDYEKNQLDELVHAYAITVHKSQGSEFKAVIIPAWDFPPMLMNRNILYTALTRAEELVVVVGKKNSLGRMIRNILSNKRKTGLGSRLRKIME
jgi:exodeoxyribonuclease V alpha subunit